MPAIYLFRGRCWSIDWCHWRVSWRCCGSWLGVGWSLRWLTSPIQGVKDEDVSVGGTVGHIFYIKGERNQILGGPHCQVECKQIFMWQKELVGQCWAGLNLNFNFDCLIQWNSRGSFNKNHRGWPEVVLVSISEGVLMRKALFNVP